MSGALTTGGTAAGLLVRAIREHADKPAFAGDFGTWTYAELGERISRVAQWLDSLGLRPGDTVAQLAINRPETYVIVAALYLRGLRSVSLHALGSLDDHAFVLTDSETTLCIVDPYHRKRGDALRARCPQVTHWAAHDHAAGFVDVAEHAARFAPEPLVPTGDAESIVRLAYTGGTTGRPKGVQLSNRALATNAVLDLIGKDWPREIRYLCAAPMSHGGGSLILPVLAQGGCVVPLQGFSPERFIDTFIRWRCTVTWLVPTMVYALLDHPRTAGTDWSRLQALIYSAAPMAPSRVRQALDVFGPVLIQSYGQTEAPNTVLTLSRHDHAQATDAQLAAAGRPYPLIQVSLRDDAGREVAPGEAGEICVRGPLVMSGYWRRPAETDAALRDGWLHTGDVAPQDADGLFYIVDRKKDLIITGGFNVYPKEVEDVLAAHPAVAAAAVVGLPDDRWGEAVTAIVVLRPGHTVQAQELQTRVRAAKGVTATPKAVHVVDALPMTALGKIDKKALRARDWPRAQA
ncbi:AMP-binding protein [Achromobacter sp. GG226]|uniref:AMP-binding protein n=1 Tax=Verticiella alkaliphila TaxID=2779529 RepID=UPI001C0DF1F2|nr:AMP-binding protein [Verticiella sp. GG226]MBU4609935.1 AMP-binding protein [Verticiella sp. GG226]